MRSDRWRLATRLRAAVGFEQCLLKRAPESRLGAPGALNAYSMIRVQVARPAEGQAASVISVSGVRSGWK